MSCVTLYGWQIWPFWLIGTNQTQVDLCLAVSCFKCCDDHEDQPKSPDLPAVEDEAIFSSDFDEVINQEKIFFFVFWTAFLSIFNFFNFFNSFNFEKKLRWPACAGHITLHSDNLPRTTKNGLAGHFRPAGQYFGHPCLSV